MKKSVSGFTIVELLIVIVVIAILAAISIVAYTGIQNRAHDTAIQSDLRQIASKLELFRVDSPTEEYPLVASDVSGMDFSITKQAYDESIDLNLTYCSNGTTYALAARSKSGKAFYVTSTSGVQTTNAGTLSNCAVSGLTRIVSMWWLSGEGGWRAWVKG